MWSRRSPWAGEWLQRWAAAAILSGVASLGCEEAPTGELVISLSSDMSMPEQIDNVNLQVLVRGRTVIDDEYAVGSRGDAYRLPATLTLAAGSNPSDPVTIRVFGQRQGQWRTVRETTTTVPANRSALVRMPIQWLCHGWVKEDTTFSDGSGNRVTRLIANCDDSNHTCIAGTCQRRGIDSNAFADFEPEDVFGGSTDPEDGECFDTIQCMDDGVVALPDLEECTVDHPGGDRVNFALRVTEDGICDSTRTACYVPLDADSDEGWAPIRGSNRVQITPGACEALARRDANALYVSANGCESKRARTPPCGAWSSVGPGAGAAPGGEPPSTFPKATLITNVRQNTSAELCCPLMADGSKLYTCLCERKEDATLVSVDPALPAPTRATVRALLPSAMRENLRFGASIYAGALFWQADWDRVRRTPLPNSSVPEANWRVPGAVYERTTVAVSSEGVFVLASGVIGAMGAPVQMLDIDADEVRSFDTSSTNPVFQFDQDERSLYLAVAVDAPDGMRTRRTARVVRMDKADGTLTTILPERELTIDDPLRGGGYTGVQVDGPTLFALYEEPAPDGKWTLEVQRVDLTASGSRTVAYRRTVDRDLSQLSLIGALDEAVVLSRIELASEGDLRTVRSSSVIVVREDGETRIVADYASDYPGQDLVHDDLRVYWLNNSGRLYGLPRTALQ
jgi:hypothetical protein